MRVLMISPQFRPLVGGYELAAQRLSGVLAAAGVSVVIIAERRERAWPAVERIDGYEVRRLSCWYRRNLHTITSLFSFTGFLLRHGREFDVWHVHQYGFHAALAVALGKALRRPVVLKLTNSGAMGIGVTLGSGMSGRILGFFHRRVSACLALTEETRAEAIVFGIPAQRIHLIPNGVDDRQFHPASQGKNLLGLLDAWAAVETNAREGALLALVGDGPDRDLVHARAQAPELAGSVHLAGQRSDVATWYRAADFYVLSSILQPLVSWWMSAILRT
jgi:glycosyltransferase involved in cell wall biosynthesis